LFEVVTRKSKYTRGFLLMIYLTFLTALALSGIAAYYSIIGLGAIFVGAFWPVVFMGSVLEISKLVTASWLYNNWKKAPILLKSYLTFAVLVLMLITSMGIFGFLAKAHIDSTLDSGANTVELKTLNQQQKIAEDRLNYLLARAKDPSTASNRLDNQIQSTQKELTEINKKRLPLLREENKLIADIGPIKYVAELLYGQSDDGVAKAVRLVIMIIMVVFDPLAVLLLIAANMSLREKRNEKTLPDAGSDSDEDTTKKEPSDEKIQEDDKIEIAKENITAIKERLEPETQTIVKHLAPGLYSEEPAPVKKLEPKYDYEAELAFREKESK
jgi:hypothetical protein